MNGAAAVANHDRSHAVRVASLAAIAALVCLSAAAAATPLQDCTASGMPLACLDARLKAANQQLNATLMAAQARLEQLQANGKRPVLGTFIDSQRKFNAYRDAQCNWQGIRAPKGENGADLIKDCQIRLTLAREQELAAFAAGEDAPVPPTAPEPDAQAGKSADAPQAAEPPAAAQPAGVEQAGPSATAQPPDVEEAEPAASAESPAAASRSGEWRLVGWIANGREKAILADSSVTIAFDPSGKVAGNASVNRYSGSYRFNADGRLVWPRAGFTLTKMAGPRPLMAQERFFLESLRYTTKYRVDGQQLVLESRSGATVLTFSR
jgi:heat shock protein HslJ/uncharacterized protein YecT (DUF1311 family)